MNGQILLDNYRLITIKFKVLAEKDDSEVLKILQRLFVVTLLLKSFIHCMISSKLARIWLHFYCLDGH